MKIKGKAKMQVMKKPIKVYFAILNKGWLRREIAFELLPLMRKMKGIQVHWENPNKTWDNPICSNRNKITKRFLQTDCDFLLMLDCDVIPFQNPADFVKADKDIIGFPAKVRQRNRQINWVAYVEHPTIKDGYVAVDFARVDSKVDLLKVDVIGTGCILIKRKVLEKLKAPFLNEFNEDGESAYGTDFSFCRKATKAGFEVYTAPQRRCEHMKEVGLNDISGYDDSDGRDISPARYDIPWGDFAISQNDWNFIKNIISNNGTKKVLEFGAGLSSLLMSERIEVLSYETSKEWKEEIEKKITPRNRLKIKLWDGGKIEGRTNNFDLFFDYDLAFVDAPLGKVNGGMGRESSIRIASEVCDKVIIHDAGRTDEMNWQNKYLKPYFKRVAQNGHHVSRCHYWIRRED